MSALTDVRTVLSRAMTARDDIVWRSYWGNVVRDQRAWNLQRLEYIRQGSSPHAIPEEAPVTWCHGATGVHHHSDPKNDAEMVAALDLVIETLWSWRDKRKRRNKR